MAVLTKIKSAVKKASDFSNNSLISVPLDVLSAVFPGKGENEDVIRAADREKARSGELGDRITKETALVDGHLNRNKILIGTTVFYSDDNFTETDVERVADGGFDFLITVDNGEFQNKLIVDCEKYGIAVIAKDASLPGGPEIMNADLDSNTLFDSYNKKPAQVGDSGWDEPNAADFPYMGKFYERYRAALPEQFLFNNLFPGVATKKQFGTKSYREYVERYSREVGADYISTDIYPFHPLKAINKATMAGCLHTYHCLGDVCRRDGKDFWLYIQTQGRWYSHIYALPTFEQIKWQVYAALCYGARSLIHVAYTPVWDKDAYAMLDRQGNLTEQYIYAKKINAEIQSLSEVLKNYRSLGVVPAAAKKENPHFSLAVEKQKKNNAVQGFSGIPLVKSVCSESSMLVGYFKNPVSGTYAMMLVNCKNLYDPAASQKVRVAFESPVNVKVYSHGRLIMNREVQKEIEFEIGSCDGVFVEFKKI